LEGCGGLHLEFTILIFGAISKGIQADMSPSDCYINCYYSALLGKDAGFVVPSSGGLSGAAITKIWVDAFDECPAL
jgi:hypothetical protein